MQKAFLFKKPLHIWEKDRVTGGNSSLSQVPFIFHRGQWRIWQQIYSILNHTNASDTAILADTDSEYIYIMTVLAVTYRYDTQS